MDGIKTLRSKLSVEETVKNIIKRIETEDWHLFAHINHAAEAKKKGLELRPTEVVLFGNPKIGTRLMQNNQSVAIDLPMKVMVWEDEKGTVNIGYNTTEWLRKRHQLIDDTTIQKISDVVERVCAQ
ncbi:MAG: DUF302 domain-containing protein [Aequorivita sp.]